MVVLDLQWAVAVEAHPATAEVEAIIDHGAIRQTEARLDGEVVQTMATEAPATVEVLPDGGMQSHQEMAERVESPVTLIIASRVDEIAATVVIEGGD